MLNLSNQSITSCVQHICPPSPPQISDFFFFGGQQHKFININLTFTVWRNLTCWLLSSLAVLYKPGCSIDYDSAQRNSSGTPHRLSKRRQKKELSTLHYKSRPTETDTNPVVSHTGAQISVLFSGGLPSRKWAQDRPRLHLHQREGFGNFPNWNVLNKKKKLCKWNICCSKCMNTWKEHTFRHSWDTTLPNSGKANLNGVSWTSVVR